MSTNKSQNLKLHLWEPQDDFLRTEFNENFTAIDKGVTAAKTELSNAIQTAKTELTGKIQTAQQTAEQLPYVTGTFTGDSKTKSIYTGFRPSFLIIAGLKEGTYENEYAINFIYYGMTSGGTLTHRVSFTNTGFTVHPRDSEHMVIPDLNYANRIYDYIAFR